MTTRKFQVYEDKPKVEAKKPLLFKLEMDGEGDVRLYVVNEDGSRRFMVLYFDKSDGKIKRCLIRETDCGLKLDSNNRIEVER